MCCPLLAVVSGSARQIAEARVRALTSILREVISPRQLLPVALHAVARHHMAGADVSPLRDHLPALLNSDWAAGVEHAPRWWPQRARHVASEDDTLALLLHVRVRDRDG